MQAQPATQTSEPSAEQGAKSSEPEPTAAGTVYATAVKRAAPRPRPANAQNPVRTNKKNARKSRESAGSGRQRIVLGISATVLATAAAAFFSFVLPMIQSAGPEAKTALMMMDTLKKMPAKESSMTVDARLSQEIETAKRGGKIRHLQGWRIKAIPASTSQFLIVFSYEEHDNTVHSAEWLADSSSHTFTPQTELARTIFGS
jgi:hypothetical protein